MKRKTIFGLIGFILLVFLCDTFTFSCNRAEEEMLDGERTQVRFTPKVLYFGPEGGTVTVSYSQPVDWVYVRAMKLVRGKSSGIDSLNVTTKSLSDSKMEVSVTPSEQSREWMLEFFEFSYFGELIILQRD